ncbi:hybrid signal transduction histidine kinase M [Artemisia annua]|uniref:Hybrid signal transduction histidine kinase M n=1 Tax=Artemisia annua TaxID=35608 RepID=A0A2U1NRS3_ARTAN|nr:hybrid signal transduction histidine kinase M [Artemisia annua]
MWILISLCDSLQEQVISTPGNANDLWDHLQGLFHDNKDARAISLDNELRSIKIGRISINEYCTKIKSTVDRLKNLGSLVTEKNLVIYAVNGLDSCFATIVKIIHHREPLLTFETVLNMLLLEESSSPTVLEATNSSKQKGTYSGRSPGSSHLNLNHVSWAYPGFYQACMAQVLTPPTFATCVAQQPIQQAYTSPLIHHQSQGPGAQL